MHSIRSMRLLLEPQMASHAEEMFVVLSDPAIYEYENEPPRSVESLRARFTLLESRRSPDGREQWLNWVIRLQTSELIGYVQATLRADGRAMIAYELSSAYWGRGLGSEAVQAMLEELSKSYGVRKVSAVFKRENRRSMRLLEKLGFTLASAEEVTENRVEPEERLMLLEFGAA
jgi:RimJ/RimL family protein N-acetyltransferase